MAKHVVLERRLENLRKRETQIVARIEKLREELRETRKKCEKTLDEILDEIAEKYG